MKQEEDGHHHRRRRVEEQQPHKPLPLVKKEETTIPPIHISVHTWPSRNALLNFIIQTTDPCGLSLSELVRAAEPQAPRLDDYVRVFEVGQFPTLELDLLDRLIRRAVAVPSSDWLRIVFTRLLVDSARRHSVFTKCMFGIPMRKCITHDEQNSFPCNVYGDSSRAKLLERVLVRIAHESRPANAAAILKGRDAAQKAALMARVRPPFGGSSMLTGARREVMRLFMAIIDCCACTPNNATLVQDWCLSASPRFQRQCELRELAASCIAARALMHVCACFANARRRGFRGREIVQRVKQEAE